MRKASEINADIQKVLGEIQALQAKLATSNARYADWTNLCKRQECNSTANSIITTESGNIGSYRNQISALESKLVPLNAEFKTATGYEAQLTPAQQIIIDAATAKQKNYKTALIWGIVIVVLALGVWAYLKYRNKA